MVLQIEKWIETLFPSQKAEDAQRRVTGEATAEEAQKRKEDAENKSDLYLIMTIMGCIIFVVAGLMMFAAWMLGARFDLAWQEIRSGNLRPPAKSLPHDDL